MSEYAASRSFSSHESAAQDSSARAPGKQTLAEPAAMVGPIGEPVQLREEPTREETSALEDTRALAGRGAATAATSLPHFDVVQAAFGHHDLSGLVAHAGGDAAETAGAMGAKGYTAGRHVVLGPGADLFTVAHEAAHFIEQQHGLVHLAGGVGAAGDSHEQRADAVAAKVVAGESVEGLLDQHVGHKGGTRGAAVEAGPVQKQESELGAAKKAQLPAKLDNSRSFEKKLGIAAYGDPRAQQAATTVIDRLLTAVMPGFDETDADHQQAYGELFGKDGAASSSGQVGTEFAALREAMQNGNLREKMTGIYNASLGGFKKTVAWLMKEDRNAIAARGLDHEKLKRRKRQMATNPLFAKDLFRDPGNPLDRKKLSSYEYTGQTRTKADEADRQTQRTVGDLDADGIGLSDREKNYQFGTTAVAPDTRLSWEEGGTYWNVNNDNKWVKKYQEKLLMPVTAGPSGTALRMFQAWEWLSKPTANVDFRLALLGWMLTGNDHSFHEIMVTSADFGMPYTAGLDAYRNVLPYTEAELRAIAAPEGFPDEENYRTDHVTSTNPAHDARIKDGAQASVLSTGPQVDKFHALITSGAAFPGVDGADVAKAMALLVYTDDKNFFPGEHVSAFQFINNVLKGNGNWWTMYYFIRKDPQLKAAYEANRFKIRELLDEAKLHAKFAVEGLEILPVFTGNVYRGYKTDKLPRVGQIMTENKIVSMSKRAAVSTAFATNPDSRGRYSILCTMRSTRGRDLGQASMAGGNEAEVLFGPGSQFEVISAPRPWAAGGADGYEIDLGEV
jgi:hypothetical protein